MELIAEFSEMVFYFVITVGLLIRLIAECLFHTLRFIIYGLYLLIRMGVRRLRRQRPRMRPKNPLEVESSPVRLEIEAPSEEGSLDVLIPLTVVDTSLAQVARPMTVPESSRAVTDDPDESVDISESAS